MTSPEQVACTCDERGPDPQCPRDGYEAVIARLEAESEALKHVQQWRAVGIDKGEGGIDVEIQPWRADLDRVKEDRDYLGREDDPPFDEILIETRWLSKPERSVETDEQGRQP